MNTHPYLTLRVVLLGAALGLIQNSSLGADMKSGGMNMSQAAPPAAPKPKNASEALEVLHQSYAAFLVAVTDSRQADVHLDSDKVIAAATTLATFAKDLPSEKRGRLTGAVNNFVKGLNALHETAHQGIRANTDKAVKTTDDLMKLIDAVFASPPAKK
jgi:hypothetical protein